MPATLTLVSEDPEGTLAQLARAGVTVDDVIPADAPMGRLVQFMTGLAEAVVITDMGLETIMPIAELDPGRTPGVHFRTHTQEETVMADNDGGPSDSRDDTLASLLTRRQALEDMRRRAEEYLRARREHAHEENERTR
ncbi:hypothetical protein [Bifidobacterium miconisargentati]|uniref:hypothetical protein n=1 Tax=Bifidobacterium miconisargentati TaxID=2834437 RepID=UPI001BDDC486|nr:hypothetical protein [Bifidobacterium miconisargentati]MBW3089210.1 hypothetical protein [Bifidobacterium miconisargentati]